MIRLLLFMNNYLTCNSIAHHAMQFLPIPLFLRLKKEWRKKNRVDIEGVTQKVAMLADKVLLKPKVTFR